MKPDISIIYVLARSGGTLVSRCLACMQDNVLLSEIHPRCAYFHPLTQAYDWFQLISREELNTYVHQRKIPYIDSIKLVSNRCRERGLNLIIRDWTHVDYIPGRYPVQPAYKLSQYEVLGEHFNVHHLAVVRDPVDTFLSLSRLKNYRGGWLSLQEYLAGYRRFAEIAAETGYVQYEEFCDKPKDVMHHICSILNIDFDGQFLKKYASYKNITGDPYSEEQQATLTGELAGMRSSGEIKRPSRREGWETMALELEDNADYKRSLEILGYSCR